MPKFDYVAMDSRGRESKGTIEAENAKVAEAQLKDKGLLPREINPQKGAKIAKKGAGSKQITFGGAPALKGKELTTFTRQLSVLISAGLPLVRALRTLEKQAKRTPHIQMVLGQVADAVEGGSTFSEALGQQRKSFDDLYCAMIKAGEASGAMEAVLDRLAMFMEKAERLKRKIKGALTYPVAVLSIAVCITGFLMVFIVPKFKTIFDDMLKGEPLPGLTAMVVAFSDFMKGYWYICIALVIGAVFTFKAVAATPPGRLLIDTMALKMPPFGGLVTKVNVARFCRTLSTLLSAGVSILQALDIVKETTGNKVVGAGISSIASAVKEGEGMSKPLENTGIFPVMMVSMVEVGEETGALPDMLIRVADIYEEEVDVAVDSLTSLIEPLMIVGLAVIVGTIVIAMFMPMIAIMQKL